MADEGEKRDIVSALKDIYGNDAQTEENWEHLKKENSGLSHKELVEKWQSDPTCAYSFWGREPNIRVLAEILGEEKDKSWRILCLGCGSGPEPYELTMRLLSFEHCNFTVEGIDVSGNAIEKAKRGIIPPSEDHVLTRGEFLQEMEKLGMVKKIEKPGQKQGDVQRFGSSEYELADSVKSRVSFAVHDIIDEPYEGLAGYDVIVCNHLLMHYPVWTRELILAHALQSLKDGGILALEQNEESRIMWPERIAWLKPYYDWKDNLSKFGLHPEEAISSNLLVPIRLLRYHSNENTFKDKLLAIRDRRLVELK